MTVGVVQIQRHNSDKWIEMAIKTEKHTAALSNSKWQASSCLCLLSRGLICSIFFSYVLYFFKNFQPFKIRNTSQPYRVRVPRCCLNKGVGACQTVEHMVACGLPLCWAGAQIAACSTLWAASQISQPSDKRWSGGRDGRWTARVNWEGKEGEGSFQ